MIPILLFFGLCFFGFGDCPSIDYDLYEPIPYNLTHNVYVNGTLEDNGFDSNYDYNVNYTWAIPEPEDYNCTKYEKVGWITVYGNNSAYITQGCVSLSNEEIIIMQNNEILEILKNQTAQQSFTGVSSK